MELNRRSFLGAGAVAAVAGLGSSGKVQAACPCADSATVNGLGDLPAKPLRGEKMHFAGRDPRLPGFAEANFKLPFKVMFIGAHPDDPDFQGGAIAHKIKRAGGQAVFVSCCDGGRGHQWMSSKELAARRYKETQASAKVLGLDKYIVLGYPDCGLEPNLELRARLTRLIRQEAPNLLITHRTSDYHADHRACGIAVRDATYLFGVPLYCPDTPVPERLPFVMYGGDNFREPAPFRADLMVSDDDVLDVLLRAWACHESQEFEWLPPEHGFEVKDIPTDPEGRIAFIRDKMMPGRPKANGKRHRAELDAAWGGKGPRYAEVFELCDYARPPAPSEVAYLRSLGFKWVGKEPVVVKPGTNPKHGV